MVTMIAAQCLAWIPTLLSEAEPAGTMLQRLTPLNQLRVIMGLFVVVMLGIFLFIVIKAGSHMVKGMSAPANRLRADSSPAQDDWARSPLNEVNLPDDDSPAGDAQTGNTPSDHGE